jgi:hypothetical protein
MFAQVSLTVAKQTWAGPPISVAFDPKETLAPLDEIAKSGVSAFACRTSAASQSASGLWGIALQKSFSGMGISDAERGARAENNSFNEFKFNQARLAKT